MTDKTEEDQKMSETTVTSKLNIKPYTIIKKYEMSEHKTLNNDERQKESEEKLRQEIL